MKIEEKQCVTLVRDFVLEKIKNKSARHELIDLAITECWNNDKYDTEFISWLLERGYKFLLEEFGGRTPEVETELFLNRFKEFVRKIIERNQFRYGSITFFPYPENALWKNNNDSPDGVVSFKTSDGKCCIMKQDHECGDMCWDEKIASFFTQLFGDKETAEMFLSGRLDTVGYDKLIRIMRGKIEFYKEKTREELSAMSGTEVIDFFEETFGKNYFRYFDLEGNEISSDSLNKHKEFWTIYKPADGRFFYHIDDEDDEDEDKE